MCGDVMLITSLDNKKIKEINKLKTKKYRDEVNKFIIETPNLIKEAYQKGYLLEVYTYDYDISLDVDTYEVTKEVMDKIKIINTSKVLGVCKKINSNLNLGDKILLLDGVQDPGNLGTIIRSAVGFNIDTIVLSNTCCDIYNDKVLRATEGAIFKINIIRDDLKEIIKKIKEKNINVYGTDVTNGTDVRNINDSKYAVIIGSEGNGITKEIKELCDKNIYIKTNNIESLNAGVATSIILYELNK